MDTIVASENIPVKIVDFILTNKIATICCINQNAEPYCFNCFYLFQEENQLLFFKSSESSFHSQLLTANPNIAGTILPVKIELLSLKGLQFSGTVLYDFPDQLNHEISFYKAHPFALTKTGKMWCIQIEALKMTDNSAIFKKKSQWYKS